MTTNNLTTIRPRLPHHILITKSVDEVLPWYCNVLGMSLVHRTDSVEGDQGDSQLLKAAWLTNDKTDHRIVLLEVRVYRALGTTYLSGDRLDLGALIPVAREDLLRRVEEVASRRLRSGLMLVFGWELYLG